jgi:ATP dependent DNA ligase domain
MLRIEPCLPSPAERPPTGPDWVHEIKHDGYRLMARWDPIGIRLLTRNGYDWSPRYPLIVEAVNRLKVRSCLIDGEAVACDADGLAVFEHLRRKPTGRHVLLYGFDLLELDGKDLRRASFDAQGDARQPAAGCLPGLRLNEHLCVPQRCCFPARLRHGPGGHCVEAARLALSLRPLARLAQVQEPGSPGSAARGRRGLGGLARPFPSTDRSPDSAAMEAASGLRYHRSASSQRTARRYSMTRLILALLVLATSILPLCAQSSSLHTDQSGYTTGRDGNRTVNTYTDRYGNTTGSIGGKYISTYSDGYGGTRGTIGNKSINTYQDGYGNTTGTVGRDRVNIHTDRSGQTIGTIGGRRLNCYTRSRTTTCY